MKVLHGHDSQATAFVVADYPYGFTLRCQMRCWIETNKKGQRYVTQTSNPKSGGWNKPKASTYSHLGVMYQTEDGHVHYDAASLFSGEEKWNDFVRKYSDGLKGAYAQQMLEDAGKVFAAQKKLTYTVTVSPVERIV